jgi:site-specific DNA-methyltransferase (adenine-specific)
MKSQVFNRDCLEAMREMPDKAFDLAIVDPPYGIGANKEKPHNGWQDWGIKQWDNLPPCNEYFSELFRVSRNQIIWGANHFIERINRNSAGWILWDKGQRDFSLADGELAWSSFNRAMRIFAMSRASALQEGKIHPTQKPVALYKWLLTNYAKPGQSILDTHLGSGSSRIAAYDLGFDFTGYELDKDYFEAQEARFANHIAQPKLFVPETLTGQPILI